MEIKISKDLRIFCRILGRCIDIKNINFLNNSNNSQTVVFTIILHDALFSWILRHKYVHEGYTTEQNLEHNEYFMVNSIHINQLLAYIEAGFARM